MKDFDSGCLWIGDSLDVMGRMDPEFVDLIYLDPPFNSNANYSAAAGSESEGAEFTDIWSAEMMDTDWVESLRESHPALHRAVLVPESGRDRSYLAYMGRRLLEMRRILKKDGSIYLHCDSSASHYLKVMMDSIFGRKSFRTEIIWKRAGSHNDSKGFGRIHDTILFYGARINTDAVRVPLTPEYIRERYCHEDENGRYAAAPCTCKALLGKGYSYEFMGHSGPWRFPERRMKEMERAGRLHISSKRGFPYRKLYLHENRGIAPPSIWTDISSMKSRSERAGYPTQKPVALLKRIVEASSDPGDLVLDPFCGSGTTCIAAQELNRKWMGIDRSRKAIRVAQRRIEDTFGMFAPDVRILETDHFRPIETP